jgi:hypothetical protein
MHMCAHGRSHGAWELIFRGSDGSYDVVVVVVVVEVEV